MAIASVPAFQLPSGMYADTALPAFSVTTLNASGNKYAMLFQAPKTGSIHKIGFMTGTVTAAVDTDLRLETIDMTTGFPSGSLQGTNTNVTILAASITATTVIIGTLTADASVTQGDYLAVVVTPSGSPNYQVRRNSIQISSNAWPSGAQNTSATWFGSASEQVFWVEYSDGTYGYMPIAWPMSAVNTHTFNSGSTPDERGLKFKVAGPIRVRGIWILGDFDNNADAVLYDSDGTTVLATLTIDKDLRGGATSPGNNQLIFASSVTLSGATFYRLVIKPGASNVVVYSFTATSAAALDERPGGQNFHYTQRTDAGAWTDTTTQVPYMGLIIDGIDDGVSAGGGTTLFQVID